MLSGPVANVAMRWSCSRVIEHGYALVAIETQGICVQSDSASLTAALGLEQPLRITLRHPAVHAAIIEGTPIVSPTSRNADSSM